MAARDKTGGLAAGVQAEIFPVVGNMQGAVSQRAHARPMRCYTGTEKHPIQAEVCPEGGGPCLLL